MKTLKILLLSLCLVLTSFGFAESNTRRENSVSVGNAAVRNNFPNVFRPIGNIFKRLFGIKPRIINEYNANVTNLTLSRSEVTASCQTNGNHCSGSKGIEIYTEGFDPENDVLTYVYKVSGGRIIGAGAKVVWDLSGVAPGTYTITVGVDDGCGICGATITKEIKVVECPDC